MRLAGFLTIGLLLGFFSKGAQFVQLTNRTATAISGDGTAVVGADGGTGGFWFQNGKNVVLGRYGIYYSGIPAAVSGDAKTAVGTFRELYSSYPWEDDYGAIWGSITQSYDFVGFRRLGNRLTGVSGDGSVIVGIEGGQTKRWTISPSSTNIVGSWAAGASISADGNTIAGTSSGQACYWTTNGEVNLLGFFDGAGGSTANAISGDGSTIVGSSGVEAFLWTRAGGMIGLGDLPGGTFSSTALGVSYDGSVVVGWGTTANGQEAFIWDSTNGMRNLRAVLQTYGVNLDNITLSSAVGVSWSGNEFCGNGTGGAWYASIAQKLECSANGSNLVFTWSTNDVGFGVEWTSDLSSGAWSWVTNSVILTNHLNTLSVPTVNAPQGFFRLRKQ